MVIGKQKKRIDYLKINILFYFSDCDDGSDEDQRYCGMYKKMKKLFLKMILFKRITSSSTLL